MCIFCKIINREIASEIIYQDGFVTAFKDVNPQAPVHLLIIPNEHIENMNEAADEILGKCMSAARNLAEEFQVAQSGYRTVINCNHDGGQEVEHLHVHLLGGRRLTWPPG